MRFSQRFASACQLKSQKLVGSSSVILHKFTSSVTVPPRLQETNKHSRKFSNLNRCHSAEAILTSCQSIREKPIRHAKSLEELYEDQMFCPIESNETETKPPNRYRTRKAKSVSITSTPQNAINEPPVKQSLLIIHQEIPDSGDMNSYHHCDICTRSDSLSGDPSTAMGSPRGQRRQKSKLQSLLSAIMRRLKRPVVMMQRGGGSKQGPLPIEDRDIWVTGDCVIPAKTTPALDQDDLRHLEQYGIRFRKNFALPAINVPSIHRAPSVKRFSYDELMSPRVPLDELQVDHLERHLTDEDLMEYIGTPRCFLSTMHESDLADRKLLVNLTPERYLMRRKLLENRRFIASLSREEFNEYRMSDYRKRSAKELEMSKERRMHLEWLRTHGRFLD